MSQRPTGRDEPYTGDTVPLESQPQRREEGQAGAVPRGTHEPPNLPPLNRMPAIRPEAPTPPQQPAKRSLRQQLDRLPVVRQKPAAAVPSSQPSPPAGRSVTLRSLLPRQPLEYRRIFKRVLWGLLAFVLVTLVGLIVVQQQVARDVALPDVRESRPMRKPLLAPMNILLAGVDSRPDHPEEGIRSDSLILLHLDPLGGWANLLAIPRDSVAEIPGYGTSKINAAFAHGHDNAAEIFGRDTPQLAAGAAIAADTAEQFLGLREQGARIDYMATVDFDGFAKMIDAIGGIDVDVPRTIIDDAFPTPDFGYMRIEIPAGRQHFDGERALQYVRTRHADSDFGRAERQQQVLRAMVERIRSRALPMKIISAYRLLRATGAAIHTTVPVGRPDAFLLGLAMLRLDPAEIGNYRIEPETVGVQFSGSDLIWDAADVQAVARQALSRPSQAQENATIQVQNSAGVGGLAGSVTQTLADDSFTTQAPATGEPAARSVIIDFTGKPRTRERLQEALGGMPVEVRPDGAAPADVDILVVLGDDYAEYVAER